MRSSGCRNCHPAPRYPAAFQGVDTPGTGAKCLRALAAALLVLAAVTRTLPAQSIQITPLAELLADRDHNFVPDRLRDTATIRGVVTTPPRRASGSLRYVTVQDGDAAVRVIARRDSGHVDSLRTGMLVQVRGALLQSRGLENFVVLKVEILGTAPVPEAVAVEMDALLAERYVGRMVRVRGQLRSYIAKEAGSDDERDFELYEGTTRIALRVPGFEDWHHADALLDGGPVELVALLDQADTEAPFDSGYRLQVIDLNDIRFLPRLPTESSRSRASSACWFSA